MSKDIIFDLETNGLMPKVDTVHCCVLIDPNADDDVPAGLLTPDNITNVIDHLNSKDLLIGHNIIGYDLPVLEKVYGWTPRPEVKLFDTLIATRLVYSDVMLQDAKRRGNGAEFIPGTFGSHSLKAWGQRLGFPKGDYDGGWEEYNDAMGEYCLQDGAVTARLYKNILASKRYKPAAMRFEMEVASLCYMIGRNGFPFDADKAMELLGKLSAKRAKINDGLQDIFPAWEVLEKTFIAKVNNKKLGRTKGDVIKNYKTVTFNPKSRHHIADRLSTLHGWKPKAFTSAGTPIVDEEVLNSLPYPEAKPLAELFTIDKRIGMISEGSKAWLKKLDDDGMVRHTVNCNSTVTQRASHTNFNIAQVPSVRKPYGKECRELFTVPKGWKMVGTDMSALEMRCFAEELSRYDGGEYIKTVLDGDPHAVNQAAVGLPTRDQAKTFFYAMIYGAGYAGLGATTLPDAPEAKRKKEGKKLRNMIETNIPALGQLTDDIKEEFDNTGRIQLRDGRYVFPRGSHSALNTLLQGNGALICKLWMLLLVKDLEAKGLKHGWDGDYVIMAWVHDELQIAVRDREYGYGDKLRTSNVRLPQYVGERSQEAARRAGELLGYQCRMDADFKVGRSWAETH